MIKNFLTLLFILAAPLGAQAQTSNGRVTTAAPTYTNGTVAPLSLDTAGNIRMNCITGCGGGGTVTANQGTPNAGGANSWPVTGGVASGSADSGNPLKTGGVYNTTNPTLTNGQRGDTQMDARANTETTLCGFGTVNCAAVQAPASDGISSTATLGLAVSSYPYLFNGTTFDRARGSTAGAFNVIRDAAGNTRGANVNASNQLSVSVDNTPAVTVSSGSVTQSSQYPSGAVAETASATGTTAATTATLATGVGKTTFICGFSIRANATAAATGNSTVTGTITGTLNFTQWTAPLASGLGITEMIFTPCVPASGTNQSIAVVSAAPGTGGTVSVSAWGYQQ